MPHLPGQAPGCQCGGCRLYAKSEKYRAHCDRQRALAGPAFDPALPAARPARPARDPARRPCRHLGPPAGRGVECPSCTGSTTLKVFSCALYGECVLAKRPPGVRSCKHCPDYEPPAPAPALLQ